MKLAVISVTNKGLALGERVAAALEDSVELFAKARVGLRASVSPFDSLGDLIAGTFHEFDGFIFIMATGIAVRVIAPLIEDKRTDPAVVVIDDEGRHAISLLSGHIGGANELACKIASAIGAQPVITTASDIANLPAPDLLAVKLDLAIEPFEELTAVSAAIVNGQRVPFVIESQIGYASRYIQLAAEMGIDLIDMSALRNPDNYDAAVIITDKQLYMQKPHVYLRPPTLAVGIGCRKGTTSAEIFSALNDACRKIGRSSKSVAVIGSSDAKEGEIGLLAAVQQLEIPADFYTREQLQHIITENNLHQSNFVKKSIGVGNVCEAAALLGGRTTILLLEKTVYPKITIAIAEVKSRWWESDQGVLRV